MRSKWFRQNFRETGSEGKKRWKIGGGETEELDGPDEWPRHDCRPKNDTQPPAAKLAKGQYIDRNRYYVDHGRQFPAKPIAPAALKLLGEFHRRRAFEEAVRNGAPIEFAGKVLLKVAKTRAHKIHNEMSDGAHAWFVGEFIKKLGNHSIGYAREVERSGEADNFYIELSGSIGTWNFLRANGAGRHKTMVREATADKDVVLKEVATYGIHSRAFHNWGD
jgi:hypothetical protein